MPLFVWEPVPDSMGPEALDDLFKALKHVDVVSPNHQELAALFRVASKGQEPTDTTMEEQCSILLQKGFEKRDGAIVVRRGEWGCYIATLNSTTTMPAYHEGPQASARVVDPTGAGNAFLGGFCIGMLDGNSSKMTAIQRGAAYGSVAASFAVEQVGLPRLETSENGREIWNGESASERLRLFMARIEHNF
ncbi:MAG: hypothetical protein MMC23_005424 [Stictis urceolatum]|nr:hypothetical protein [Stictis urceolata]